MAEARDQVEDFYFFQSPIYKISKKDFLESVSTVADESVAVDCEQNINSLHPVCMSGNFAEDPRIDEFATYVLGTAWNILESQGYAIDNYDLTYTSMWMQEHHKNSSMNQHVHGEGNQIIAFYFLKVPEDGCHLMIHDPRPGKLQVNLQEIDPANVTLGSRTVVIRPEEGDLIFTNAWLPHSFSKNGSEEATKFVHINIAAYPGKTRACKTPQAEVV